LEYHGLQSKHPSQALFEFHHTSNTCHFLTKPLTVSKAVKYACLVNAMGQCHYAFFLIMNVPLLSALLICLELCSITASAINLSKNQKSLQTNNNQEIADLVYSEVSANPSSLEEILRRSILSVYRPGDKISDQSESAIIAIVAAVLAASTRDDVAKIVSAGVGVDAALAPVVAKASLSIFPKGIQSKLEGTQEEGGRVLGNVRVIKIIGRTAKTIDREGKTSALKNGEFLRQGSHVFTGSEGDVTLLFDNGSTIQLDPETEFSIDQFIQDPFEAKIVDYKKLDGEPSKSSTRLTVESGTIFTNVKKLKTGSTFQVTTPVGTMGIRGTGFFIRSLPGDGAPAVSFGVSNGQVQFTTASGATQSVQAGQSFGVGGAEGGGNFTPNPPGATGLLESTANSASSAAQSMPSGAFNAAPPATPAPAQALSNLSPDQQQALEQAAVKGASAVVEEAAQLAVSDPSMAATIASAAAELSPGSALQIATGISAAVPLQASAVAVALASTVPAQAATIAAAVATAVPSQAIAVATAVAAIIPSAAPAISAAVSTAVPAQAALIASSVSTVLPSQAPAIAAATASAVPAQAEAISTAVAAAVPSQAAAVSAAVNSAAQGDAANTPGVISDTAVTQNPGALTTPTPSPTQSPTPTPPTATPTPTPPTATPTPTPTPVSPSA
jgi:hypothetical protein